ANRRWRRAHAQGSWKAEVPPAVARAFSSLVPSVRRRQRFSSLAAPSTAVRNDPRGCVGDEREMERSKLRMRRTEGHDSMVTDRIRIFDTTLRDGEQSPGAAMTLEEKLEVAEFLDAMGVDIIEA